MGTLILNISNFVQTLIFPVILYKFCFVAISKYFKTLALQHYVYNVAVAPDLRKVFLYSATNYLHHSSTIKLLLLLIIIKGSYPSFKALLPY